MIKRERGCEKNAKKFIVQNLVFKMFSVILFYKKEKNKEPPRVGSSERFRQQVISP